MQGNYTVRIEKYAERHFIDNFEKKYRSHWDVTLKAITFELEHIDSFLLTDKAEIISDLDGIKIIKTKFAVAKSGVSAKSSGNRCIVAVHEKTKTVCVLLVYGKTDLSGHNETLEWKGLVRENYPEYREYCK
jgi:hypothetical protein